MLPPDVHQGQPERADPFPLRPGGRQRPDRAGGHREPE
jgi:hypothetical protein